MVKAIMGSPIVRRSVMGAMFAAAAMGVPAKNNNDVRQDNFYNLSTSEMRMAALSNLQNMPVADDSKVRNEVIDKKVLQSSENENDSIENVKGMNKTYSDLGIYGASIFLQRYLNDQALYTVFKQYAALSSIILEPLSVLNELDDPFGLETAPDPMQQLEDEVANIQNTIVTTYRPYCLSNNIFNKSQKPSFEVCSKYLDDIVEGIGFNENEKKEYYDKVKGFENETSPVSARTTIDKSNILAYKAYLVDYLVFRKLCNNQDYFKKDEGFQELYKLVFSGSVVPTPTKQGK